MAIFQRQDIDKVFAEIKKEKVSPVYLLFGERYLCREVMNDLISHLLPSESSRRLNVRRIDGEQEDVAATLAHLQTYSLFPGRQVIRVTDSQLFFSRAVAKNLWDKARKAHAENRPEAAGRFLGKMLASCGLDSDEPLAELSDAQWKKLFGFARPQDAKWCESVPVPEGKGQEKKGDAASLVCAVLEQGIPKNNVLVLMAEAVDKRKKVFKTIGELGTVIDLSVDTGTTAAAKKGRDAVIRELIVKALADMGKKPGPRVIDMLLDRVGFHPVAAVLETEKLALSAGPATTVTEAHVEAVIGRTREEAIYELNEAVATRNLPRALTLVSRLQEGGLHPLALVASLRNLLRRLLFVRAIQSLDSPPYPEGSSFPHFQKGYLPRLKASEHGTSPFLDGHPYVIYKTFQQAEGFDLPGLKQALADLLATEFLLKGSGLPPALILERFLFSSLKESRN